MQTQSMVECEGGTSAPAAVVADLVAAGSALPEVPALTLTVSDTRRVLPSDHRDDPYNAVCRWVEVRGRDAGPLNGVHATVKDSIAVGGLPMTCGSAALDGFIPTGDASVVRMLLDAGAELVAMTTMDDLALSGGGDSSVDGPVINPHDPTRSAGGSSGGAAASLFYDEVDLAIGTDQGGSTRVPASWCGVLGLKPTRGLIPYTGVVPGEPSLDHVGLLTRDPILLERALRTVAASDGTDVRQLGVAELREPALADHVGARAAVLSEVVRRSHPAVADAFARDCERLQQLGVTVVPVDLDPDAFGPVATGLFVEGLASVMAGTSSSYGHDHVEWRELTRALRDGVHRHEERLSSAVRATLEAARILAETSPGESYGRAAAQARPLTEAMMSLTAEFDFVLTPTTPFPAFSAQVDDPEEEVRRGWAVLANTGFVNVTGQPALSVPLSLVGDLPSGLQVIGARGADLRLIRLAQVLLNEAADD